MIACPDADRLKIALFMASGDSFLVGKVQKSIYIREVHF